MRTVKRTERLFRLPRKIRTKYPKIGYKPKQVGSRDTGPKRLAAD